MDGVWGYSTGSSLNEKEKKIMRDCRSKYGDLIDKFLSLIESVKRSFNCQILEQ